MSAADDQLASGHAGILYFVLLTFKTGPVRLTTWTHDLEWDDETWLGYGSIIGVSKVESSVSLQYPALDLSLSVSDPAMLALARGQASEYRGRPATLYQVVLDDDLRMAGDPEVAWGGLMDQVRFKTGDGTPDDSAAVVMRCEMAGRDNRAAMSLRLNNAQHQAQHSGDTFLSRVEQLTGQPAPWLSIKFQRQD